MASLKNSAKSDLSLPQGLAPSETMVSSAVNPINEGFSVSGAPFCGFGLTEPAPKG